MTGLVIFVVPPNQLGTHLHVSNVDPLKSSENLRVQFPAIPTGVGFVGEYVFEKLLSYILKSKISTIELPSKSTFELFVP